MANKKISQLAAGGALQATDEIPVARAGDNYKVLGSAFGGSQPGVGIVRGPFVLAFDDVGLADGLSFYTPTINDVMLDVWIEVDVAFDGTTPLGDIGTSVGSIAGLFSWVSGSVEMGKADSEDRGAGCLMQKSGNPSGLACSSGYYGSRAAPLRFTAANPLKVWVSQNGLAGGDPVGGTAGQARVYFVISTPVAP